MRTTEEELRLIKRLKHTQDGYDFREFIESQIRYNHTQILGSPRESRDELVGYGICLSELLKLFSDVDEKLSKPKTPQDRY